MQGSRTNLRDEARTHRRCALVLGLTALLLCALRVCPARAQSGSASSSAELPKAALLSTAGAAASGRDGVLDSVVQTALEKLGVVSVTARPGMDLGAIELAIDCVGETPACLRAVASQSEVQIVIAPALQRGGQELVLTLLYFDAAGEGELRRVTHRQNGSELAPETLDAVPDLLATLFRRTNPTAEAAPASEPAPEPARAPSADANSSAGSAVPIAPLLLGGAGVVVLGSGLVVGLIAKGTQSDYGKLPVNDGAQAKIASDKLSSGRSQALISNVLLGVGAAALVAGGVWLALALSQHEQAAPQTALLPVAAPGQLGLVLVHRGPSL
jgi:hypothetical protein